MSSSTRIPSLWAASTIEVNAAGGPQDGSSRK
jgi:hypothetical protein